MSRGGTPEDFNPYQAPQSESAAEELERYIRERLDRLLQIVRGDIVPGELERAKEEHEALSLDKVEKAAFEVLDEVNRRAQLRGVGRLLNLAHERAEREVHEYYADKGFFQMLLGDAMTVANSDTDAGQKVRDLWHLIDILWRWRKSRKGTV